MKMIKHITIALALVILLTACNSTKTTNDGVTKNSATNLSIEETKEFIQDQEDLFILDVRNKDEYDAGHIEGAVLIPLSELENRIDEVEAYKDKPILVYCRSGNRSSQAVKILLDNDFLQIYHMKDGYMNFK